MNRVLLTTSMMTPAERAVGRFMRAPDHPGAPPPAGGTPPESGTIPDNQGGNSGESGNPPEGKDNAGKPDELEGFWDGKPEEPKPGESDESKEESTALGGELKGLIDSFVPPPVFTKEIGEQIAEGNFDEANKLIQQGHQAAIRSSIVVTSKLIGAVVQRLQADFDVRINAALGNKDNSEFLKQNFPQAKNPTLAPMVERVFNQAMVNSKGNREDAIRLTRGMLGAMGKEFAPDDLRNPPDDLAGLTSSSAQSLVDSLLDRG
jgi:hypothetical protein